MIREQDCGANIRYACILYADGRKTGIARKHDRLV